MAARGEKAYVQDYILRDVNAWQALVISTKAAEMLGWDIKHNSRIGFIATTGSTPALPGQEIRVRIADYDLQLRSEFTGNKKNNPAQHKINADNFATTFREIKATITAQEIQETYLTLQPDFVDERDIFSRTLSVAKVKINSLLFPFIPQKDFFITPLLIDINIAVFLLMALCGVNILSPTTPDLMAWGANYGPYTLSGQPWRLLTSTFLHGGPMHLLMNMYALLYVGLLLEPHLKSSRFLLAYLMSGIAASVWSIYSHSHTVSVGASGAIFGLYGVFLAILTTGFIEKAARRPLIASIAIFLIYNLAHGISGNTDNAAHIGGLVAGIIIGYIYVPSIRFPNLRAPMLRALLISFAVVASVVAFVFFRCSNIKIVIARSVEKPCAQANGVAISRNKKPGIKRFYQNK